MQNDQGFALKFDAFLQRIGGNHPLIFMIIHLDSRMPLLRRYLCLLLWVALPLHAATIMVFGDSLSAGYGLQPAQGWVTLLAHEMAPRHRVVNVSQSGETTAGGLTRLPQALEQYHPDVVILELGANDGLRGLPLEAMRANLQKMIRLCRQAHARIVLVGIALPPNYGTVYVQAFHAVYDDLATHAALAYVPSLMAGFGGDISKFQSDGLHPAAEVQPEMMRTVKAKLPPIH